VPTLSLAGDGPTAVDMFAGIGGATIGLAAGGFDVRAAWETDPVASYAYRVNHTEGTDIAQFGDATDVRPDRVPNDLDLLFGATVSGFSSSGGSIEDDPRNQLAFCVPEWADAVAPKVVVVENVVGLQDLHGPTHSALVDVLADAGDGYTVATVRLDAADYNVPQARERVFLVAVREDCPTPDQWEPPVVTAPAPTRTLTGTSLPEYDTAGDALDELPAPIASAPPADDPVHETIEAVQPGAGEWGRHRVDPHTVAGHREVGGTIVSVPPNHVAPDHAEETRAKYAEWALGYCGSRTTDRRLHPDQPAPTMTVSDGVQPIHYQGRSPSTPGEPVDDVRRLTVREVARLQTFPDMVTFAGTRVEQYRQAANAAAPESRGTPHGPSPRSGARTRSAHCVGYYNIVTNDTPHFVCNLFSHSKYYTDRQRTPRHAKAQVTTTMLQAISMTSIRLTSGSVRLTLPKALATAISIHDRDVLRTEFRVRCDRTGSDGPGSISCSATASTTTRPAPCRPSCSTPPGR